MPTIAKALEAETSVSLHKGLITAEEAELESALKFAIMNTARRLEDVGTLQPAIALMLENQHAIMRYLLYVRSGVKV